MYTEQTSCCVHLRQGNETQDQNSDMCTQHTPLGDVMSVRIDSWSCDAVEKQVSRFMFQWIELGFSN